MRDAPLNYCRNMWRLKLFQTIKFPSFLTGSSLMYQDSLEGGLDLCTEHDRWAVSPTWNCFLSTLMTGPSDGKSEIMKIIRNILVLCFNKPITVMFAVSAKAKKVGVTVTSQRYVPLSLVETDSNTTLTWSDAVIFNKYNL